MSENSNKTRLGDTLYLEIKRVEIVGDLYDADSNKIGDGNYGISLFGDEVAALSVSEPQILAGKFFPEGV